MRVLIARSRFPVDGVETAHALLAGELERQGVEVHRFYGRDAGGQAPRPRADRLHAGDAAAYLRLLDREQFDVVQVVATDSQFHITRLAERAPRIVAVSHCELTSGWTSRACFAVAAVSQSVAALFQPLTDLGCEAIPNGVDTARFTPPVHVAADARPIVAWVGRSNDLMQKDFPRFARVGARLGREGVRLWVADAAHGSYCPERIPPGCSVEFERWERVSAEGMPEFYRQVAASGGCLLSTSTFEGFPGVVTEGAASGLTTIAPRTFGFVDTIEPGVNGQLFELAATDEDVAALVGDWLAEIGPARERIALCRALAEERFSPAEMARRYVAIYERETPLRAPAGQTPPSHWDAAPETLLIRGASHDLMRAPLLMRAAAGLARGGRLRQAAGAMGMALQSPPREHALPCRRRGVGNAARRIVRGVRRAMLRRR